jgi:hypothetical protein
MNMARFENRYKGHDDVRGKVAYETFRLLGVSPEALKLPASNGEIRIVGEKATGYLRLMARCERFTVSVAQTAKHETAGVQLDAIMGNPHTPDGNKYRTWKGEFNLTNLSAVLRVIGA